MTQMRELVKLVRDIKTAILAIFLIFKKVEESIRMIRRGVYM